MHKWFMFVLALAVGAGVLAQGKPAQRLTDPTREQRRVELRTVLQAQRHSERASVDDKTPTGRQLTSQEHAELRQQLRDLRADRPASP